MFSEQALEEASKLSADVGEAPPVKQDLDDRSQLWV